MLSNLLQQYLEKNERKGKVKQDFMERYFLFTKLNGTLPDLLSLLLQYAQHHSGQIIIILIFQF